MPAADTCVKQTFDNLPGALFLTDTKGKVVYANNAMETRTGFSVGEIVGKRPRSEEHTSELQSQFHIVCRPLLDKKNRRVIDACRGFTQALRITLTTPALPP